VLSAWISRQSECKQQNNLKTDMAATLAAIFAIHANYKTFLQALVCRMEFHRFRGPMPVGPFLLHLTFNGALRVKLDQ
jgi:hypothetical protein